MRQERPDQGEGTSMSDTQYPLPPRRDSVRLLLEDLACISGTLSEIMTAWRRAAPGPRPGLPLGVLTRLQNSARRLAADIEAASGPGRRPDPALSVAERFSALREEIARTRAATRAPGAPEVVDRGLWELVTAALHRAETHLADLTPHLPAATG
jgi:hypothetical protein